MSKAGHDVFLPLLAPHSRVDLVADVRSKLLRIQVKSARIVRSAVVFHSCSNTGNVPKDYAGDVDAFGVYSPALHTCYLVPIADAPSRACSLRLAP
ncbi:MAG: group I intron-associated PD-(D/E)XK endonuclease, partial [Acidimicrobiales bacterium]